MSLIRPDTQATVERIRALCETHPDRHVGGDGDRAARELFARHATAAGFSVEHIPFDATEWIPGEGAWIEVAGERHDLHIGPFSDACDVSAPLVAVDTVEALESLEAGPGVILLLHGAIAAEQLTPRHYPFYAMEEHGRILAAIDAAQPSAVVAATGRTPMAAGLYPFPLFEDADFGHPSAFLRDTDGERLAAEAGTVARLHIASATRSVSTEQLVARIGPAGGQRVIVSGHIDSRYGTPGALDNAAGVATLLAVADILSWTPSQAQVELVPFNGEDDYAAPGEMAYLAREGALNELALVINVDAVGRAGDLTAVSFYACPEHVERTARAAIERHPSVVEGPSWPMSDHMVFAMRSIPAIAVTSTGLLEISATVAHTAADLPELVDPGLVVDAARWIVDVIDSFVSSSTGDGYQA